jgi:hypothetical protein
MKLYIKTIDGVQHILPKNKIVVVKDGMQTFNPTEKLILSDGWKVYKPKSIEPTEEELIELERNALIDCIKLHDSSDEVNIFYIGNLPIWLDKNTRAGLLLRFQAEIATNIEETTLWYDSIEFKLTPQHGINMLYALEVYASKCYDRTQYHIANAKALNTVDDLRNYNFKTGYPAKLYF